MKSRGAEFSDSKVSVLIPTFNRADYLGECLDSILNQTLPAIQIIVINDGSVDHTRAICEAYKDSIEYLELNQLGKSCAINYGLDHVSGDYVWIFDDDDVALPDALERFVEPLKNNTEYGFSYSSFFFSATDSKTKRIGSIMWETVFPDFKQWGYFIPLLECNFLGGAALFARTSCYKRVGMFDPKLFRSQDYEMAIRIAQNFKGIEVLGGATFHYRQHEGARGSSRDRFTAKKRGSKWFEYDQIFFRKFYQELPLADYIPSRNNIDGKVRQAILQRMYIMVTKKLYPEILKDLELLAQVDNREPFSPEEYFIIRDKLIANPPDYDDGSIFERGSIFDCIQFFDTVCRLSKSSSVLRLLRNKIFRTTLGRYSRSLPKLSQSIKIIRCLFHLYFFRSTQG